MKKTSKQKRLNKNRRERVPGVERGYQRFLKLRKLRRKHKPA